MPFFSLSQNVIEISHNYTLSRKKPLKIIVFFVLLLLEIHIWSVSHSIDRQPQNEKKNKEKLSS